jgi:hypothetical protein
MMPWLKGVVMGTQVCSQAAAEPYVNRIIFLSCLVPLKQAAQLTAAVCVECACCIVRLLVMQL